MFCGSNSTGALLRSLRLFSFKSSSGSKSSSPADCAVCLDKFNRKDRIRRLPACDHAFHAACIDTWLRSKNSCPLCRSVVPPEDVRRGSSSRGGSVAADGSSSRGVSRPRAVESDFGADRGRPYSLEEYGYVEDDEALEAVIELLRNETLRDYNDDGGGVASYGYVEDDEALEAVIESLRNEMPQSPVAAPLDDGRGWMRDFNEILIN